MWAVIEINGERYKHLLKEGTSVIGRDPSCEICLSEPSLSRRHLECVLEGGQLVVNDLNSKNGTFLGIQRIHEVRIQPGIRLRAGNLWISFREEESATGGAVSVPAALTEAPGAEHREAPAAMAPVEQPETIVPLEETVPKAENYEEDETPTPLDAHIAQDVAAGSAGSQSSGAKYILPSLSRNP